MELHIPEGALEEAVGKGLRATLMQGAVNHIVKELTPERMNTFVTGILDEGLKNLNSWELRSMVSKTAEPMMKDYSMRPDFIAAVEACVKEGMEKFLKELPDIVYNEFREVVVGAIVDKYKRHR